MSDKRLPIKLKVHPKYFDATMSGLKMFEIRKNDRDFRDGDILILQEWDPVTESYTGENLEVAVTYLTDFAQKDGYVVMGIHRTS